MAGRQQEIHLYPEPAMMSVEGCRFPLHNTALSPTIETINSGATVPVSPLSFSPAFPGSRSAPFIRVVETADDHEATTGSLSKDLQAPVRPPPDLSLPDELYYLRFAPVSADALPSNMNEDPQRQTDPEVRAVVIINADAPKWNNPESLFRIAESLQALVTGQKPAVIEWVPAGRSLLSEVQIKMIQSMFTSRIQISGTAARHSAELIASLKSADFAVFADDFRYPDAIAMGLPVLVCNDGDETGALVNHAFHGRRDTKVPIRASISDHQTWALQEQLARELTAGHLIDNSHRALTRVIQNRLGIQCDHGVHRPVSADDRVFVFPDDSPAGSSTTQRVSRLTRKFRKFRQSPKRFFQDSELALFQGVARLLPAKRRSLRPPTES